MAFQQPRPEPLMPKVMTSCGLKFFDKKRKKTCPPYEENILNLVLPNCVEPEQPKRYTGYISCMRPQIKADMKRNKNAWRTMGHALEPLKDPDKFLKKGCGIKQPTHCVTKRKCDPCDAKPPIPKEPPFMNQKRETDFIKINAANNILNKYCPTGIRRGVVDDRKGHFEDYIGNQLEKKYVYKPCYGRSPKYLLRRYKDSYYSRVEEDKYNGEFLTRGTNKLLCEEERQALLWGLKHNWETVNKEYICHVKHSNVAESDKERAISLPSRSYKQDKYKVQLENELDSIKRDIDLLEKHNYIFVPRDV